MTRTEFVEEVLGFQDLIDFCNDNGCDDIVQHIYDKETVDGFIMEAIQSDCFGCDTWQGLYAILDEMPDCEWYDLEWGYEEAEFESRKDEVLDYMDDNGLWEEEEDEEDEEEDDETSVLEELEEQVPEVDSGEMMALLGDIL